jgi:hypothetical protein
MQVKEFLIEQDDRSIWIIDLTNDHETANIALNVTEDKNEMKKRLDRAFEITEALLLKRTEYTFKVCGLTVRDKALIEEVDIYDEVQKNTKRIFITASRKLLDKAKEIAENILQLK